MEELSRCCFDGAVFCNATLQEYNCYSQIKEQYKSNLENGFLDKAGSYHPALKPAAYRLQRCYCALHRTALFISKDYHSDQRAGPEDSRGVAAQKVQQAS